MPELTPDELDEQVEAVFATLLDAPPARDDDGDIPLQLDACTLYVSTVYDARAIDVWAPIVVAITDTAQAAFTVHFLNNKFPELKFRLLADRLIVGSRLFADPLVTPHVERLLGHLSQALAGRDEIAAVLGGRTPDTPQPDWRDDEQERERTILRTIFELQHADSQISADDVIAICHGDQQTVLNVLALSNNLETQLRSDAEHDLDPTDAANDRASADDWKHTSDALRVALRTIALS
ncbi:hypothetical protein GOEFS_008_00080 [Gordonia effusa NBRC 100432]|uniref:YbjN domain-containing protein n=1 Tax=Gordonia effusa NBRC 100432 TaxID=1077974 RepID=H0QUU8_9ACTN|nr:hypothetical protein [Gordonia effusa]GAB16599.1 hypothetical protein GOEFS_008_00080 [Gordonia effusa NBRC 100432]